MQKPQRLGDGLCSILDTDFPFKHLFSFEKAIYAFLQDLQTKQIQINANGSFLPKSRNSQGITCSHSLSYINVIIIVYVIWMHRKGTLHPKI